MKEKDRPLEAAMQGHRPLEVTGTKRDCWIGYTNAPVGCFVVMVVLPSAVMNKLAFFTVVRQI